MRVLSFVAGIVLLVTGLASIVGRRADVSDARDQRLETTADLLAEQLDATVTRATAALGVATADTTIERLADAIGLPVCAITGSARTCTTPVDRIVPQTSVDEAVAAALGQPDPVALVVPDSLRLVVAADQDERTLLVTADIDASTLPSGTTARLVPVADEPLLSARSSDGQRMFATPSLVEFDGGPLAMRTSTSSAVRLTAGSARCSAGRWRSAACSRCSRWVGCSPTPLAAAAGTTDALTQLPIRNAFERRATETLARLGRDRGTARLLVIDQKTATEPSTGEEGRIATTLGHRSYGRRPRPRR